LLILKKNVARPEKATRGTEETLQDFILNKYYVFLMRLTIELDIVLSLMKRIFDLIIVLVLSPLWVPLALFTALAVRIFLGTPVIFIQSRPGLGGKSFTMYKFRSMTHERALSGDFLPDEARLTLFGRFLRASSLDELPELFNVLRGDMSLVGPRPLLEQYLPIYSVRHRRRHDVMPGLTGWAQINGRNSLSWHDKFELDIWYVDNQSIILDLKILYFTIWKVISARGVNGPNTATMLSFTGYEDQSTDKV
jgi:lipopolysaccharide/colanic/teichoic acid biosynthesis glycosyltransferase